MEVLAKNWLNAFTIRNHPFGTSTKFWKPRWMILKIAWVKIELLVLSCPL